MSMVTCPAAPVLHARRHPGHPPHSEKNPHHDGEAPIECWRPRTAWPTGARDRAIRNTLANFPDGLLTISHGIVHSANRAFMRLYRPGTGRVEGRALKEVLADIGLVTDVIQALIRPQAEGGQIEVECCDSASIPRILQIRRFQIDGDGTAGGDVAGGDALEVLAFADVTERWKARRSMDMLREQLLAADRRAAAGEISMALAHEINQPLGAIINFAGAARRKLQGRAIRANEIEEALQNIAAEAARAAEVIKSLRSFLRGKPQSSEPADVNAAVKAVLGFAEPAMQAQGVRVTTSLPHGLSSVQADLVILQQILLNLVTNAVQAMSRVPPDRRHLAIRTGNGRSGTILIIVDDTGVGLPVELGQQIFEPFVTTKDYGSGLGLSIARTLVQRLGGSIEGCSRRHQGARFIVRLPCGYVEEAGDA